ncbi:MAG: ribosome recycling factor [Limisphaerales bacterium]|jgi:ribosome recycling factor
MSEELKMIYDLTREEMQKSLSHMESELVKVRAGKASPSMVGSVMVDYYGSMSPLPQVANISTPDARTITIQPWEKALMQPIEKAILQANLGLTPQNNGEVVILSIPPLTEERRRELVKQVQALAEDCKIGLRQSRKIAIDEIKVLEKDGLSEDMARDAEAEVQKIIKDFSDKITSVIKDKEEQIMTV